MVDLGVGLGEGALANVVGDVATDRGDGCARRVGLELAGEVAFLEFVVRGVDARLPVGVDCKEETDEGVMVLAVGVGVVIGAVLQFS